MRIFSKILLLLLIVSCIVALLPAVSIADDTDTVKNYRGFMEADYNKTLNAARGVDKAHDLMTALGAKYDASQSAISAGNTRTVASIFGVTVTAFATGGTTVAWAAIISAVTSTSMTNAEKESALTGIGGTSLVDAYESAIEDKKSAIEILNSRVAVYNMTFFAWSQVLNAHDNWDTHEGSSSQAETHASDREITWVADWEVDTSLPSFACGGGCGESFITPPGSHWTKCGTAQYTMDEEARDHFVQNGGSLPSSYLVVKEKRKANPYLGCGEWYYTCQGEEFHVIRYCDKQRTRLGDDGRPVTGTCNDPYRRCLSHAVDHNPTDPIPIPGGHAGRGPGLYPSDGNTMSPGDTHTADLITKDGGYIMIYWYLLDPGDTPPYGDQLDITYGLNNGNTEVEFSFALPDDAAVGSYKFNTFANYPGFSFCCV